VHYLNTTATGDVIIIIFTRRGVLEEEKNNETPSLLRPLLPLFFARHDITQPIEAAHAVWGQGAIHYCSL
jgi:hypothetical protein